VARHQIRLRASANPAQLRTYSVRKNLNHQRAFEIKTKLKLNQPRVSEEIKIKPNQSSAIAHRK